MYRAREFPMKKHPHKIVSVTQAMNDGRFFNAHPAPGMEETREYKPGYTDLTVIPHNRTSEVDTSILQLKLTCPECGKKTIHAEFPDQYECWIKCSSCNFFIGMSKDEWHKMENSPNLNEKIKKMVIKKDLKNR
jgi:ribosomal protein S27AE